MWRQDKPEGVWLERLLMISELKAEDFNINYSCRANSPRGNPDGYFTLLPAGTNTEAQTSKYGNLTEQI